MLEKLKGKKLNIRQRVLRTFLACVLVAFLGLLALSIHTIWHIEDSVLKQERSMAVRLSEKVGDFTEVNIENRLKEGAEMKARAIDTELMDTGKDVELLAQQMTLMLTSPENYTPRQLANSRLQEDIASGVPYVHYSPELAAEGISPELAREIAVASNLADTLQGLGRAYGRSRTSIYAGSRKGYLICLDLVPGGGSIYPSAQHKEEFLSEYDPAKRPWFTLGKGADKPVYTDAYRGADGFVNVTCVMPYYDSEGFAGVAGISYSIEDMYHQVADAVIGRTGANFAMDKEGRVIFSGHSQGALAPSGSEDLRKSKNSSLADAARRMTAGGRGLASVTLYGQDYLLAYAPMESTGWSFGSLIAKEEVTAPTKEIVSQLDEAMNAFRGRMGSTFLASAVKAGLLALLLLAAALYLSRRVAGHITEPIYKLRDGVREISAGNLEEKVNIDTGDEIQELADSFNAMTEHLEENMEEVARAAKEKERAQAEMKAARSIQQSMLPAPLPVVEGFDIRASMKAAKEVGGDFYDYLLLDDGRLMFAIADVSGKGVPAALFMVRAMTVLRSLSHSLEAGGGLADLVSKANDELCRSNEAMMFVTAFVGVLELETGRLSYVNAGHIPPQVYRRKEGKALPLEVARNFVLGSLEDITYKEQETVLDKGDILYLCTDGVIEAQNEIDEFYGEERLRQAMALAPASPHDLREAVAEDLKEFVGKAEQFDDITMVVLGKE